MCGITGYLSIDGRNAIDIEPVKKASASMQARGPDGSGIWIDDQQLFAAAHRRLAIIDLSPAGAQPMVSSDGRYVITYNGELYNYRQLRDELISQGQHFRSESDTEVILVMFAMKREQMLRELRGMFAFAIWDTVEQKLFLARDHFGIKPLYYFNRGGRFGFASQVKALRHYPEVSGTHDYAAIVGYHLWGHVPEPLTMYADVACLPAGHYMSVTTSGASGPVCYFDLRQAIGECGDTGFDPTASAEALHEQVRHAVGESIRSHLVSDVEVGLFLSAGVDSASLLAHMSEHTVRPHAITLGFQEYQGTDEDETILASLLANQFDATHEIDWVDAADFRECLPTIMAEMDQPSIDGINTWFVSRAAKRNGLKVALSGVGGDEVFAGYPSFADIPRLTAISRYIPGKLRSSDLPGKFLSATGLARTRPKAVGLFRYSSSLNGAYLLRRALYLPEELPQMLNPETLSQGISQLDAFMEAESSSAHPLINIAGLELFHYTKNQLLRDADWAGMAHSVEIRTPLVDVELITSLAACIPYFGKGQGKQLLATSSTSPLPTEILQRAKTGFTVPISDWLLRQKTTKGLSSRALARQVLLDYDADLGDHYLADLETR